MRLPGRTLGISGGGSVFDPRTGDIFLKHIGTHLDGGSPGIYGDVVIFGSHDHRWRLRSEAPAQEQEKEM